MNLSSVSRAMYVMMTASMAACAGRAHVAAPDATTTTATTVTDTGSPIAKTPTAPPRIDPVAPVMMPVASVVALPPARDIIAHIADSAIASPIFRIDHSLYFSSSFPCLPLRPLHLCVGF